MSYQVLRDEEERLELKKERIESGKDRVYSLHFNVLSIDSLLLWKISYV